MADDIEQPPRGYNTEDVKAIDEKETPPPARKRRRWGWKLILLAVIIVPALLLTAWAAIALSWSFSDGERVGFVNKFSRKGWLCKTWEGELTMQSAPYVAPQLFPFTVRDDAVATRINQAAGKKVALVYEQHKGLPTSCFGETEYFIKDLRILE